MFFAPKEYDLTLKPKPIRRLSYRRQKRNNSSHSVQPHFQDLAAYPHRQNWQNTDLARETAAFPAPLCPVAGTSSPNFSPLYFQVAKTRETRKRTQVGVAVEQSTGERLTGGLRPRHTRGAREKALTCHRVRRSCPPSVPAESGPGEGAGFRDPSSPPASCPLLPLPLSLSSCCSAGACHYPPLAPKLAQPQFRSPRNWKPDTRLVNAGEGQPGHCAPPSRARPERRRPRPGSPAPPRSPPLPHPSSAQPSTPAGGAGRGPSPDLRVGDATGSPLCSRREQRRGSHDCAPSPTPLDGALV